MSGVINIQPAQSTIGASAVKFIKLGGQWAGKAVTGLFGFLGAADGAGRVTDAAIDFADGQIPFTQHGTNLRDELRTSVANGIYTAIIPPLIEGVRDVVQLQACGDASMPTYQDSFIQKPPDAVIPMQECLNQPNAFTTALDKAAAWQPFPPTASLISRTSDGIGRVGGGIFSAVNPFLRATTFLAGNISALKVAASTTPPQQPTTPSEFKDPFADEPAQTPTATLQLPNSGRTAASAKSITIGFNQ